MHADRQARVVVGVAESIAGLRALRVAVAEAHLRRAVLHAVRVWYLPLANRGPGVLVLRQEVAQNARLTLTRAFTTAMGGPPVGLEVVVAVVEGKPGPALTAYADRDNDLLVVGTGSPRRLSRPLSGSIARYCMKHVACPIQAVPPDAFARSAHRIARTIRRDLSDYRASPH